MKWTSNLIPVLVFILGGIFIIGAGFDIGMTVTDVNVTIYQNASVQLNETAYVNFNNLTIELPVTYSGFFYIMNVSVESPTEWYNESDWRIVEDGLNITVTEIGSNLTWEANPNASNISLFFEIPSPILTIIYHSTTSSLDFQNMSVASLNHIINVSATVNASENHTLYNLYEKEGSSWTDVTNKYHLLINGTNATFWGFNLSTKYFKLEGYCEENWTCSAWSSGTCGTRTCSDSNSCGTTLSQPSLSLSCGGGGGGGGGFIAHSDNTIEFEPDMISLMVEKGEKINYDVLVKNLADRKLTLESGISPSNFITTDMGGLILESGEDGSIVLYIDVPENASVGMHTYKYWMATSSFNKTLDILLNIVEEGLYTEIKQKGTSTLDTGVEFSFKILDYVGPATTGEIIYYIKKDDRVVKILNRKPITLIGDAVLDESFKPDLNPGDYELCGDFVLNGRAYRDCTEIKLFDKPKWKDILKLPEENVPEVLKGNINWFGILIILLSLIVLIGAVFVIWFLLKRDRDDEERKKERLRRIKEKNKILLMREERKKLSEEEKLKLKEEELKERRKIMLMKEERKRLKEEEKIKERKRRERRKLEILKLKEEEKIKRIEEKRKAKEELIKLKEERKRKRREEKERRKEEKRRLKEEKKRKKIEEKRKEERKRLKEAQLAEEKRKM